MARLSGLPSEHHHEGPGDAPRRKRGRPSKSQTPSQSQSQSQAQDSQSQSQDSQPPSKRTASPSFAESSQAQAKRTKRVQAADEDQIADEVHQSLSRSQRNPNPNTTTHHPARRHSELPMPVSADADDADLGLSASAQAPAGLTPHLNRIGARPARRPRPARQSMPARLGVEPVDEAVDGTQFQYAPLTAVLDGRTRRRLRRSHLSQEVNEFESGQKKDKKRMLELQEQLRARDAQIRALTFELEAVRMGNIDMTSEAADELELKLQDAQHELDALRASSLYNGSDRDMSAFDGATDFSDADDDDDDDNQLLLVDRDDLNLSRDIDLIATPTGKYASRLQELSSQMTFESLDQVSQLVEDSLMEDDATAIPDKIEDQAVQRYERELHHHVQLLAQSQGALRIVTLELQNLHFLDPGHSSTEILVQLRHAFDSLRLEMEKLFPNSTTGLTNQQLLHKIPELFGGIFFELKEKLTTLNTSQKTQVLLRRQYEGVLDLLADSEARAQELEQKEYSLDKSNEEKQRTISHLEEQITTLTDLTTNQETALKDRDAQITLLGEDIQDKDTTLDRLREALDKYRQDLETATQTATAFEIEHHAMITRMEEEHSDTVRGLQAELEAEQAARDVAEGDAIQKGQYIEDLEARVQRLENDLMSLTEDMAQLTKALTNQTEARETTEVQRDEQAEMVYEYANKIENLGETITDLKAQLKEFQDNLASERMQREQTEAALDEANAKIDNLNQQVHHGGIQANELRSKLFALQQEKDQTIKELQEQVQEREDVLNTELHTEREARAVAEKTVIKLNKQIEQLQAELATADIDLTNMTQARQLLEQDREQQVLALSQQLADLTAKYTALETSTQSTINALQTSITDLNNQVQWQQAEIKRLTLEIADKDQLYENDTHLLKEEIVELKGSLDNEREDNIKSRKEIDSLSQRVEHEANEVLSMVNSHNAESTALKTTISTLEATIQNHQVHAEQYAAEYEQTLTEHNKQIEELELLGTARVETITVLTSQIEDLKARFAQQEEDTRVTIDSLNLAHRRLLDENEKLAEALKLRNAANLKAVQDMKAANVAIKTQNTDLHHVQTGKIVKTTDKVKVAKKGSKKRVTTRSWRDSGIFDDGDEDAKAGGQEGVDDDEFLAA